MRVEEGGRQQEVKAPERKSEEKPKINAQEAKRIVAEKSEQPEKKEPEARKEKGVDIKV